MSHTNSPRRRAAARLGLGTVTALAIGLALPGAAQAHVTVQPGAAEGGGFSVISFRVPNERDDASSTRLRVTLPEDQPLGSVQTTPVPGWKVTTTTRELDEPIEMFGQQLDRVVSRITWTATDGGIQPGQVQDFDVSLGQLPASGELVFNALQTYSSGEKVNWNEVAADPAAEPEHPAPVLTLTPAAAEPATDPATGTDTETTGSGQGDQADSATQTDESGTGSDSTLPIVMSGDALVLSLLAAVLAWRRGRPVEGATASPSSSREGANV